MTSNDNQSKKTILKIRKPKDNEEYDTMYIRAYYIGKFILHEIPQRFDNFVKWLKMSKESKTPIRFVYNDKVYDFEIFNNKTEKWLRIGRITSQALLEERGR
jgi:hypothetical protein